MSKLTKTQLVDQLAALREHCDRTETQLARVTTERDEAIEALHRLKGELLAAKLPAPKPLVVRKPYTPHALPAHFAAAREAAMRMGAVVKVSA